MNTKKGRVTVPTDVDVIEETLNIIERWGADAIRDCDGTSMPEQLRELDVKQYATYYTTRKDNAWASANPQEIQQMPQGAEPSELHSSGSESQSARRTSGAVPDMAVEDAGGSTMEMMGGLAGGL